MNKDYVLTIIFSKWTLSKIYDFFKDYLNSQEDEIGPAKIERFKDKRTGENRDSNRTVVLMKRTLFKRAIEAKLDVPSSILDFRISEYILREKNFPIPGYSSNFYLIIPKNIPTNEAELAIIEKLYSFYPILNPKEYTLNIPLSSRITGEHRGFAYLSFFSSVTNETRAILKILLNDSFIYLPSIRKLYHIPAFWTKDIKPLVPQIVKIMKR